MSTLTSNFGLTKDAGTDYYNIETVNDNLDIIDKAVNDSSSVITASGTGTAIILTVPSTASYAAGRKYDFIAFADNGADPTTININSLGAKSLYKSSGTTAPTIRAGKAYTIYYSGTNFFLKASATGDAVAADVLADKVFSNDTDTDIAGTIQSKAAHTYTPGTSDQTIPAGQYLSGVQTIKGDANLVADKILAPNVLFGVTGTAKRRVSGTASSSADGTGKVFCYGGSSSGGYALPWISVSGLAFKPSSIVITYTGALTNVPKFVMYASDSITLGKASVLAGGYGIGFDTKDYNAYTEAYVNTSSFLLPVFTYSATYSWVAYE
jgi:hypothetical protein